MLETLFLNVIDKSIAASIVILAVIAARFLLKGAPKWISYALWAVVLVRLVCPVHIPAPVSLLPELPALEQEFNINADQVHIADAGAAVLESITQLRLDPQEPLTLPVRQETGELALQTTNRNLWLLIAMYLWPLGVAGMLIYSGVSCFLLKRKLTISVPLGNRVYLAEGIDSAFVIGLVRPKIYLPETLTEGEREYILRHERCHIRRKDHIFKILGFAALVLHWFNPLVWVAFVLACQDMEMSCDEAVVKQLGSDIRADYSASLLKLSTGRRIIAGMPLAFGEGDTRSRIKNLANWKKPVVLGVAIALVLAVVLGVCLLTDPFGEAPSLDNTFNVRDTVYRTSEDYEFTSRQPEFGIYAGTGLCRKNAQGGWEILGFGKTCRLDPQELARMTPGEGGWQTLFGKPGRPQFAIWLSLPEADDHFYLFFRAEDNECYLGYGWEDVAERGQGESDDTCLFWLYRLGALGQKLTAWDVGLATGKAVAWLDFANGDSPDAASTIVLPELPHVTFCYDPERRSIRSESASGSFGHGVSNPGQVCFADVDGNGIPDLCYTSRPLSDAEYVSRALIVVLDSAFLDLYDPLNDRIRTMYDANDYALRVENGVLICQRYLTHSNVLVETGTLEIQSHPSDPQWRYPVIISAEQGIAMDTVSMQQLEEAAQAMVSIRDSAFLYQMEESGKYVAVNFKLLDSDLMKSMLQNASGEYVNLYGFTLAQTFRREGDTFYPEETEHQITVIHLNLKTGQNLIADQFQLPRGSTVDSPCMVGIPNGFREDLLKIDDYLPGQLQQAYAQAAEHWDLPIPEEVTP